MRMNVWLAGFGLMVAVGAGVAAQQGGTLDLIPPVSDLKFIEIWRPASGKGQTQIVGTVIDIQQVSVAKVTVRLRDLNTGAVLEETDTNENGEFQFEPLEPSAYVGEMVLAGGYVVATSNAVSLARYETVQTVIQLPGRWDTAARNVVMAQNMAAFVGMSSATTLTAATLRLAVNQNIAPVDSGEPVSPDSPVSR